MALTATITPSVRMQLEKLFETEDHVSIVLNPCKPNITYFVSEYKTLSETFEPMLRRLRHERTICPHTIIYCRRLEDCANLYLYFMSEMGESFTKPHETPCQLSKYRLVDMFTSCTDITVKNQIIASFTSDSCL